MINQELIANISKAIMLKLDYMNPYGTFGTDYIEVDYVESKKQFQITFYDLLNDFDDEWCDRITKTFAHELIPENYCIQVRIIEISKVRIKK